MQTLRQGIGALLVALVSLGLVLGSLSLSLVESGGIGAKISFSPTPSLSLPSTYTPLPTVIPGETLPPSQTPTPKPTIQLFSSPTIAPNCQFPTLWKTYVVQIGDSLSALADQYGTDEATLIKGNCLVSDQIIADSILHLPPFTATPIANTSTATLTDSPTPGVNPTACNPPEGWVAITIQHGDNLYKFSITYHITITELQAANCMGTSILLVNKTKFYVPFVLTPTPTAASIAPTFTQTYTQTLSPTLTETETSTLFATQSMTPVKTSTASLTPVKTDTPTETLQTSSTQLTYTQIPISTITFTVSPTQ